MKKIFTLIIALVVCAGNANAFEYEPEEGLTFMGVIGLNVSDLQNHAYDAKAGMRLGARADYMLPGARGTYLTAGFGWTMKGGKGSLDVPVPPGGPTTYNASAKYQMHYLELPIRVGFRYNLLEQLGLYAEFGPYFALGVGGNHSVSIDEDGPEFRDAEDPYTFNSFKNTGYTLLPNGDPKASFQHWDAGLGFRIGAEYNKHYNLMIGCDWGLSDIYRTKFRDAYAANHPAGDRLPKVHNFNFSISFGYRF